MKLWIDDVRPAPEGYVWCRSTDEALKFICHKFEIITEISLDHDAGEFQYFGGDFINVLNKMEELKHVFNADFSHIQFHLHSANPVGVANMRAIIEKNGWKEMKL